MKKYFSLILALSIFFLDNKISLAQSENSIPVTLGATFFGNYSYTVKGIDGQDFNKFDVDRVYFTAKSQMTENWKFQLTTDVYRNSAAGTYYAGFGIRLKFAFLDYSPWSCLSIKAGMIPGPWNGSVEAFWKYRGVAQTANDKYGYIQTADLGASVTYSLPEKYGELAGYIFNGDGYTAPESNNQKDVVLRASVVPFPAHPLLKTLTIGAFTYSGKAGVAGLKKNRTGALLGYSYNFIIVAAEYDSRTDGVANAAEVSGSVLSLFTEIKLPVAELQSKFSFIFRYDSADPNKNIANDKTDFFITGFVWKATEKISIVLDRQVLSAESAAIKTTSGTYTDKDEKWFVHTILTF